MNRDATPNKHKGQAIGTRLHKTHRQAHRLLCIEGGVPQGKLRDSTKARSLPKFTVPKQKHYRIKVHNYTSMYRNKISKISHFRRFIQVFKIRAVIYNYLRMGNENKLCVNAVREK